MPLNPGTCLGRYELVALIGVGGMGEVYRAYDSQLRRSVAIKVLPEGLASEPQRLVRLESEARAASALNHPAIVSVFDFGREGDTAYIVSELLEGETLRQSLKPDGLPLGTVFDVGLQLAGGLLAAHALGIVHGDIKPENLFLTRDGRLKILDFGLAQPTAPSGLVEDGALTAPLDEISPSVGPAGTLGYLAPERLRGESGDHRIDIFAFGVVLYEMTTGRRPFAGNSSVDILDAVLHSDGASVERSRPDTPPTLVRIIERCLKKRPEDRFQTAADLAFALETASLPTGMRSAWRLTSRLSLSPRAPRRRAVTLGAAALLLATGLAVGLWHPWTPREREIRSIAVLPLANLSGDASQDYLVDGIHEELIASLAKIHSLRVISRTSVMRYRDTRAPVRRIARELKVDAVLEGSVRRAGDQVRTTFQLLTADNERHLWAETYQARMRDILVLQSDVARAVADEVRARLTPEERSRLGQAPSVDPEAYQVYLQGRFEWNRATPSSLRASVALFERAVALDPSLTLAHAGLAEAHGMIGEMEGLPPARFLPEIAASARHALDAGGGRAEAHASLGFAILYGAENWDWARAETAFARAIDLSPGYANAHAWRAQLLSLLGRHDDAIAEARRASELDPFNPFLAMLVASRLYYAHRFPEALAQAEALRDIQPDYWLRHWIRGLTLAALGRHKDAVVELRRAVDLSEGSLECVPDLAAAQARAGEPALAHAALTRLRSEAKRRFVSPYSFALVHDALGERTAALDGLERAYAEHDWRVAWIGPEPALDDLRGDARYKALLAKLGLPQNPAARR